MEAGAVQTTPSEPREPGGRTLCSVCVCTYRRPDLLGKLLESLAAQTLPEGLDAEVIVVDNDSARSAGPVLHRFPDSSRVRFSYSCQPAKNISLARNMTVEKATGEYLLFIDDDEVASPEWIRRMLETLGEFGADGAFGPVIPVFHEEIPPWKRRRELYYQAMQNTGESPVSKWTGNCIVRASLLKSMKEPFDPRYGITGGEDSHLFERLERQGARFVYCREAWVSEYFPPSRANVSSLFLRGLRYGSAHTRRKIEFAGESRIGVRVFMVMKALVYGTISSFLMVLCFASPARRTKWLMKLASNAGRFMAAIGWNYEFYP